MPTAHGIYSKASSLSASVSHLHSYQLPLFSVVPHVVSYAFACIHITCLPALIQYASLHSYHICEPPSVREHSYHIFACIQIRCLLALISNDCLHSYHMFACTHITSKVYRSAWHYVYMRLPPYVSQHLLFTFCFEVARWHRKKGFGQVGLLCAS